MTINRKIVEAFTGTLETSPLAVNVRMKDLVWKIYVGFGEIRIPIQVRIDVKSIEKEHDCKVKETGMSWIVTPNIVKKLIERDGALCSAMEEHRKALEEWMEAHGVAIIRTLILGY